MLDLIILIIRGTGQALGSLLNLSLTWSNGVSVHVYDIVIFIALIYLFIKLFAVITNNQVISRKG